MTGRPRMPIPAELRPLIDEIRRRMRPQGIWLFGSRARGDNRPDSDWDLLVSLPDDAEPALLDPMLGWSIQSDLGIPATILSTTASDLQDSWGAKNTIGFDLARDGRMLDD